MDIDRANVIARDLLDQHGFSNWALYWVYLTDIAGQCFHEIKMVMLSRPIIELNDEAALREIMLHEIAHAMTNSSHDEMWRAMALKIGCSGTTEIELVLPESRPAGLEC